MDVQYGIAVTNKYDLFLDEDKDPLDLIQEKSAPASKEDKAAKKKEKKKLKEAAVPVVAALPAKTAPKNVLPETKAQDVRKDRDDKENKPAVQRDKMSPRRGGGAARPMQGQGLDDKDRRPQRERPPRQDRGEAGPPKRSGFVGQYQDDVPPRFAGNEERGGFGGGESNRFGDRFGESGPRGRGRGGGRGFGRGRGGFNGGDRGGFGGGGGPQGGFRGEENHVDGPNWPANENDNRGGFGNFPPADEQNRGGFSTVADDSRGGFGTFGDEEGERASGARPLNREFVRGGRRGGSRPRGAPFGGGRGRQFDRQSGSDRTGVKSTEKRDGSGSYNWGTTRDELAGETEVVNTTLSDETPAEGQPASEQQTEAKEGEELKKSESDEQHELTLDEWKALQAQKEESTKPQFNIRRPGDGEDPSLWKKLVPLAKKEKEHGDDEEYDEDEDDEDEHHRKKQVLNIEINFIDQSPRGGGRGARGGGMRGAGPGGPPVTRGFGSSSGIVRRDRGGGRGGTRSARGRGDQPYRLDEDSFPGLPSAPVSA